jgi:hypothetical protein
VNSFSSRRRTTAADVRGRCLAQRRPARMPSGSSAARTADLAKRNRMRGVPRGGRGTACAKDSTARRCASASTEPACSVAPAAWRRAGAGRRAAQVQRLRPGASHCGR